MKVIGIDPGLAATGVGIVRGKWRRIAGYAFGCIHTPANTPLPDRLNQIFSKLLLILKDEKPDLMVVEDVFSLERYPKAGIILGKATGVILLAGCQTGMPINEIPVREAKQVLTGNGNASKKQLEKSVRCMLNLNTPIKPFHASDAMALALIGLLRRQNTIREGVLKKKC